MMKVLLWFHMQTVFLELKASLEVDTAFVLFFLFFGLLLDAGLGWGVLKLHITCPFWTLLMVGEKTLDLPCYCGINVFES